MYTHAEMYGQNCPFNIQGKYSRSYIQGNFYTSILIILALNIEIDGQQTSRADDKIKYPFWSDVTTVLSI